MKVSTLFLAASLLASASAQGDESGTTLLTADPITSSSTTEAVESTVTLPAASCSSAGFEHCYRIIEILTPTVYVIVTADDPATVTGAEPITSGDPILTQTDNIASSGESISAPTTAVVEVLYSQTSKTTCDPATITSVLADDGDMECVMATAPFFTAPDQVTKTRVIRKAREDDTQGKGTETSDGGAGQTTAAPAPGSTSDDFAAVTTTDPAPEPTSGGDTPTEPAPTDEPAPTTEDNSQPTEEPTEEPTDGPTEEPTGTSPTSTEEPPQETENPTGTLPTTTIAPDVPTTTLVTSSSSSTSASEETPSSDSTFPTTDPSTLETTDPTSTPTENTPTSTDSNNTPTDDLTTQPSGQESSSRAPTGKNESGKPEVSTAFTTIAETSGGTTRFVTSAVATMTRSAPSPSTSDGGSGAGSNFLVKAQVLFGAVGLAAVVGL